ncbi:MAG: RNA polymerase sigma factor RpoD/SigA [Polyangia bacterium]|jgi:RNA polymerase nonessential primary-like sigma factor|nr:RNA polymerase sigma factor RpoD/SigA [Polyangia bacterium]
MTEGRSKASRDLDSIVKKGERQGYLTALEIFSVLSPDLVEDLDDLLVRLHRSGVNVVDTDEDGERLSRERRAREAESAGDALTSYLREINGVHVLNRAEEIRRAKEFRSGIDLALRSVAETSFFLEKFLTALSQARRQVRSIWEVVIRISPGEGEDEEAYEKALLQKGDMLARLRRDEKRTRDQLERRGISKEKTVSLSERLKKIRSSQVALISSIPVTQGFMKEATADLLRYHHGIEELRADRESLIAAQGSPKLRGKGTSELRDPGDPDSAADAERRLRNLRRKIQRLEKMAGMSSDALRSVAQRHQTGMLRAQKARDALILSAQRLVLSSARYYGRRLGGSGMEISDLISEGNRGLIRAVELFDPKRGNRFSTFASYWVRHQMIRAIHTQSRTVYVPPHIRQQMSKILMTENELLQRLGQLPTDEELAKAIEMDVPSLRNTLQSFGRVSSIDRPLDPEDAGSGTYGDTLADERDTPDEALLGAERREIVRELADLLQGRERAIVFMRMGWENDDPKTLAEIGEIFGISRQRVEQLEKRALTKLRKWAKTRGMEDPLR